MTTIQTNNSLIDDKMQCAKCHSPRIIRFIDGFGEWRIFCRSCQESFLIYKMNNLRDIKTLPEFSNVDISLKHEMVH